MKSYLFLKENLFDSIYDLILKIDNDKCLITLENINRYTLISVFIKALQNVQELSDQSIFFNDYNSSTCIESFYNTILKPNLSSLDMGTFHHEESNTFCYEKKRNSLFDEFPEEIKASKMNQLNEKQNHSVYYMISNAYEIEKLVT